MWSLLVFVLFRLWKFGIFEAFSKVKVFSYGLYAEAYSEPC